MKFVRAGVAAITAAVVLMATSLAWAGNAGSVSGNKSSDCTMSWHAAVVLDADMKDVDTAGLYSGDPDKLWRYPDGTATDYSNGGFITEVNPTIFHDPGVFEVQHYLNGGPEGFVQVNFRYYVGTPTPITQASLKLALPKLPEGSTAWTYTASSWGPLVYAPRSKATWTTPVWPVGTGTRTPVSSFEEAPLTVSSDSMTIGDTPGALGYMPANSATTIVVSANVPIAHQFDSFVAQGWLTGNNAMGVGTCVVKVPPAPIITPEKCVLSLAGQTVFPITAPDITVRDKWDSDGAIHLTNGPDPADDFWRPTSAPVQGEINADGWDVYPSRTLRLYAGVTQDATRATLVFTAAQGFTFGAPSEVLTAKEQGMDQLYANGYTVPATGIGSAVVSADGKTLTLTVDAMPAHSAIAFNVATVPDGSGAAYVVNSTLTGSLVSCPAATPTPTPEPSATPTPTLEPSAPTAAPASPSVAPQPLAQLAPAGSDITSLAVALALLASGLGLTMVVAARRR